MNALDTWTIHTETGPEGPYTREQLRDKLEAGRLKPEDKLVLTATREALHVADLFPDAVQIARRTTSERIRRTGSSGRQAAATPTPTIDAGIADLAADKPVTSAPTIKPVTGWHGRRSRSFAWPKPRVVGLAALVVAALIGIAFVATSTWEGLASPVRLVVPAATALDGNWIVDTARLEAPFKGLGQGDPAAMMYNQRLKMVEGFSLTVGGGQATLSLKTQQGATSGPVQIATHPGAIQLVWAAGGKNRTELFSVYQGEVAWQLASMSIPLMRAP